MSLDLKPPLSVTNLNVTGRIFVITGGTQGLGLAIAERLQSLGAKGLVLVSRSAEKGEQQCQKLTTSECIVKFVRADLSQSQDAMNVIPQAIELMKEYGPLSGLVNAAATTGRGNLFTTTSDSFDFQIAVNVRAPFLLTQAIAKHMIEFKKQSSSTPSCCSIVNICSVASLGGAPFILAYSTSKSALVTLTKNNAAELAPHGIRVNGINMGWTLTENENNLQTKQSDAEWSARADASVPLGRILRPQDVASTVCFLLSDASAMMTGSIVDLHPEYAHGMLSLLAEDKR